MYFHPELPLTRHYNSLSDFSGLFGLGWCSNIETKLNITENNNLEINYCGNGQTQVFTKINSTTWENKNNPNDTITKTSIGWKRKPNIYATEFFNIQTGLISKILTSKLVVEFFFDLNNKQINIKVDQLRYTLVLDQNNLITKIKEIPQIQYQYDLSNRMTKNANFWNTEFTFNYFSNNQLKKIEIKLAEELKSKNFLELSYFPDKQLKSAHITEDCVLTINADNKLHQLTKIITMSCKDQIKNYRETITSLLNPDKSPKAIITRSYSDGQNTWTKEFSPNTGLLVKQVYNQNQYVYHYQPATTLKSITSDNISWNFEQFEKRCHLPMEITIGNRLQKMIYQSSCLPSQIQIDKKNYSILLNNQWQIESIKINGQWVNYQALDSLNLAAKQSFLDNLIEVEELLLPVKLAKDLYYE